ncbi:MAG: hypothetical protein AAB356_00490, partial [Deltaproteobacteria bacterium]
LEKGLAINHERFGAGKTAQEILDLTLASYNAGPSAEAVKAGNIPQNGETPAYVKRINYFYKNAVFTLDDVTTQMNQNIAAANLSRLHETRSRSLTHMESHRNMAEVEGYLRTGDAESQDLARHEQDFRDIRKVLGREALTEAEKKEQEDLRKLLKEIWISEHNTYQLGNDANNESFDRLSAIYTDLSTIYGELAKLLRQKFDLMPAADGDDLKAIEGQEYFLRLKVDYLEKKVKELQAIKALMEESRTAVSEERAQVIVAAINVHEARIVRIEKIYAFTRDRETAEAKQAFEAYQQAGDATFRALDDFPENLS